MDFELKIREFAKRVESIKDNILTEESTKTSVILPFFQLLGYDIFNPSEFVPEFTADVGIKKGEKVDYAILLDNVLAMLIECKGITDTLTKHDSQLFRYFGTSTAKFAILTNGVIYKFFTDLEEPNKMDETPFLEIDILNLKDAQILELKKFQKENFDINSITDTAADLKYMGLIRNVLKNEFSEPTDDFIRFVLNQGVFEGVKTQNIIEKYRPLIKKSLTLHINELVNDRIKTALNSDEKDSSTELANESLPEEQQEESSLIITTEEEIQSFYIIKSILAETIDLNRIFYKDTQNYFAITVDDKVTRWICRIYLKENVKFFIITDDNKVQTRYDIQDVDDLYTYKELFIERCKSLL